VNSNCGAGPRPKGDNPSERPPQETGLPGSCIGRGGSSRSVGPVKTSKSGTIAPGSQTRARVGEVLRLTLFYLIHDPVGCVRLPVGPASRRSSVG
jgi:hypothetical protein